MRKTNLAIGILFLLLLVLTAVYYTPHIPKGPRGLFAFGFVVVVGLHPLLGYRMFRSDRAFPWGRFLLATAGLGLARWLYSYWVLRHYLPAETIFHHPERVAWFQVPSSALLIFSGYGLALYRHLRRAVEARSPAAPSLATAMPANGTVLHFRAEGKDVRLPLDTLLYVRANGAYMLYQCADRRYIRFQRMKKAQAELAPAGFVRIHRSYLVARAAVRAHSSTEVELIDGTVLPVSRTYRSVLEAGD